MSTRNKDQGEKVIMAFMEAVYPGNAELAMTSFNEIKALQDATAELTFLRAEVERLREGITERDEKVRTLLQKMMAGHHHVDGHCVWKPKESIASCMAVEYCLEFLTALEAIKEREARG